MMVSCSGRSQIVRSTVAVPFSMVCESCFPAFSPCCFQFVGSQLSGSPVALMESPRSCVLIYEKYGSTCAAIIGT